VELRNVARVADLRQRFGGLVDSILVAYRGERR
jgi:hypothetical protein